MQNPAHKATLDSQLRHQLTTAESLPLERVLKQRYSLQMPMPSSTIETGALAPTFTLAAANQEGTVSLSTLVRRGPVIIEFLRGTW